MRQYLANNVSVVIEAAFSTGSGQRTCRRWLRSQMCSSSCALIDDEVAARRHLERGLIEPKREFYHGDRRVREFRETGMMAAPEV